MAPTPAIAIATATSTAPEKIDQAVHGASARMIAAAALAKSDTACRVSNLRLGSRNINPPPPHAPSDPHDMKTSPSARTPHA